jgi:HAD superfamily hydrolase (TIGR01509 family)
MQEQDAGVVFDLDGTLIDSVYQHVQAWCQALREAGIDLSIWRVHRRVGMSGGLMVRALGREIGRTLDDVTIARLERGHAQAYAKLANQVCLLPGTAELLATLTREGVPWAIATSSKREQTEKTLRLLDIPPGTPVVTRDEVERAKPNPDLFLAAAAKLGRPPGRTFAVGDSAWDILAARRAGALGVGVLSGGYGLAELTDAGAYRVYQDPADLLAHLDELGLRIA